MRQTGTLCQQLPKKEEFGCEEASEIASRES